MDFHFSNILRLLKNGQKYDSFAAHLEQHFKSTKKRIYLRKCITLKVVNNLNLVGSMKTFTNPNCNIYMEKHLTIPKKLRNKCVTIMKNNLEIYGACRRKKKSHQFLLSTYDTVNL